MGGGKNAKSAKGNGVGGGGGKAAGKAKHKDATADMDDADFDKFLKQLKNDTKTSHKEAAEAEKKQQKAAELKKIERQMAEKKKADAVALKSREMEEKLHAAQQRRKMQELLQQMMANGGLQGGNQFGGPNSPFLKKPETESYTEAKQSAALPVQAANDTPLPVGTMRAGMAEMQGWRRAMEDAHFLLPDWTTAGADNAVVGLYGVFDGHAGKQAAKFSASLLPALLLKELQGASKDVVAKAVPASPDAATDADAQAAAKAVWSAFATKAFQAMDDVLRKKVEDDSGCTAVVTIVTPVHVICASVGDSRAVLANVSSTTGGFSVTAVPLAFDHKPEDEAEKARIEAAGGFVRDNRTDGALAMSRALGDFVYKVNTDLGNADQKVSNVPDVHVAARRVRQAEGGPRDFLLVACDGIFDVLTNDAAVAEAYAFIVAQRMKPDEVPDNKGFKDEAAYAAEVASHTGPLGVLRRASRDMCVRCCAEPHPETGYPTAVGTDNMTICLIEL